MMKYLISLTLVLFSASVYCQGDKEWIMKEINAKRNSQTNQISVQGGISGGLAWDFRYEGVKGTPLVLEEWKGGAILFSNNNLFATNNELINVDLVQGQVLIKLSNQNTVAFRNNEVKEVYIEKGEDLMIFKAIPSDELNYKKEKVLMVEELCPGEFSLYKEHKKQFIEANYEGAYSPDRRHDEFRNEFKYYVKMGESNYVEFKPKSKNLEKLFPNKSKEIKSFSKENSLDLKSDKDLIKLFNSVLNV